MRVQLVVTVRRVLAAANLDLRQAVIVIPSNATMPEHKSAAMLTEEIEKRTQLRLKIQTQPAARRSIRPASASAGNRPKVFR